MLTKTGEHAYYIIAWQLKEKRYSGNFKWTWNIGRNTALANYENVLATHRPQFKCLDKCFYWLQWSYTHLWLKINAKINIMMTSEGPIAAKYCICWGFEWKFRLELGLTRMNFVINGCALPKMSQTKNWGPIYVIHFGQTVAWIKRETKSSGCRPQKLGFTKYIIVLIKTSQNMSIYHDMGMTLFYWCFHPRSEGTPCKS